MKGFQKIALVTAIAAAPMSGFAMEQLEDEALAAVTGQDGVTISIASTTIGGIRLDDQDGFGSADANGAIFISGFSMSGATTIVVDADVDTIQAAITLGSGTMGLGAISATATGALTGGATNLITLGSMTHGDITANVQLGDEDQGAMIVLTGTVTGGLVLSGFSITDTDSTGSISANVTINDAGAGTDLTLSGNIDATAAGLTIAGLPSVDVTLGGLTLGGGSALGDVSILNLSTGTVTISGH